MANSQNVRFSGQAPEDKEFDHPKGASIARLIRSQLKSMGWTTGDFDNWRDSGWSIPCSKDNACLDVVIAGLREETEWMLQIAPAYSPGLLGRLLGKKSSATPKDCFVLAKQVHEILKAEKQFSQFMWCWDDFPDEKNGTAGPTEPK
jgi:hypothetical protein